MPRRVLRGTPTPTRRDPSTGLTQQTFITGPDYAISDGNIFTPPVPPTGGGGGSYGSGDAGDLIRQGGVGLCSQLLPREICEAAADLVENQFGNGGGGSRRGLDAERQCDPGFTYNDALGICEFTGSPGDLSTNGNQGLPPGAVRATVVGEIRNRPIRRCPPKFVLADPDLFGEGVCFHKKVITNRLRKWPKRPKAKISAYDWRMMKKYGSGGSKQKKAKEFAQAAGFSCKKK